MLRKMTVKRLTASFVLTGLLAVVMSACGSTPAKSQIQLKGNPTTGFTWLYESSDPSLINIEESVEYLGADGVCGAPSMFTWNITPLKTGETVLHFSYRRPWENAEPLEVRDYRIVVDEKSKVFIEEIQK